MDEELLCGADDCLPDITAKAPADSLLVDTANGCSSDLDLHLEVELKGRGHWRR